jgi:hypothetical protein
MNMPTIIDYKASVPSNEVNAGGVLPGGETLPVVLTAANSPLVFVDLGMFLSTGAPNRVEVKASIGVLSTGAPATIELEVYRDQMPYFAQLIGIEPIEGYYAPSILAIDFDVPAGFHRYRLEASLVNASVASTVTIIGPIECSGLAIALP